VPKLCFPKGVPLVVDAKSVAKERVTRPRLLIAQALGDARRFVSAQQVIEVLKRRNLKVGAATVYRNLNLMAERGEVDVIHVDGETFYRECSDGKHHHHVICRICGHTVEIEVPGLERWIDKAVAYLRYRDVDHDLEIFGICPRCVQSQNQSRHDEHVAGSVVSSGTIAESDNYSH